MSSEAGAGGGNCWSCGAELTALDYGRADTCKRCGRDTKTCKGCIHYDASANNECREPQAERVLEKERSNFCDYFKPSRGAGAGGIGRDAAKAAAEALFGGGKKKADEKVDPIKAAAEALFKK